MLDRVGAQSNRRSVQLNFIVVPACLSVLGFELSPTKTEGSGTRQCSRLQRVVLPIIRLAEAQFLSIESTRNSHSMMLDMNDAKHNSIVLRSLEILGNTQFLQIALD